MSDYVPFKSILLVVDSADASLRAAACAVELAAECGASLTAVGVVDTDTLKSLLKIKLLIASEMQDMEEELEADVRKYLNLVQRLARERKVDVEIVMLKGSSHSSLMAERRRRSADIIVLGGFSSSETKRDLVAREKQLLMDNVTCPVLVVR